MECPLILQNLCFQPLHGFARIQHTGFEKSDRSVNIIVRYRADMHIECIFRHFAATVSDNELQPLHVGMVETIDRCLLLLPVLLISNVIISYCHAEFYTD